ncbi:MAG: 16S rRNA (guanine(966)-N(2))-methyltransferase RsmD [Oscillospiraceae bacterium]|nr:16S rRNA (guanine(966)-N(2))-methyltransferase RsmD [Oscillospiraceae bacterium]
MRIIAGSVRGLRLETLTGNDSRPTAAKVKEAVFSAIQFEIDGRQVLDLFAGSGQMGLEALSRGAAGCVFVDNSAKAAKVVRNNLSRLLKGLPDHIKNVNVINTDAMSYLKSTEDSFDLVFIDPPYASNLLKPALDAVQKLMNKGGVIVCESDADTRLPEKVGRFFLNRVYNYGRVHIWLYRYYDESRECE